MHRNPRNSFFREVATVLHDTEMEIRVEGNWFTRWKIVSVPSPYFFERKDRMKRIIWLFAISMRFESRLINSSGKENYCYRMRNFVGFLLSWINKHLNVFLLNIFHGRKIVIDREYTLKEIGLQDEKLYWFLFVESEQINGEYIPGIFPNILHVSLFTLTIESCLINWLRKIAIGWKIVLVCWRGTNKQRCIFEYIDISSIYIINSLKGYNWKHICTHSNNYDEYERRVDPINREILL